MARIKITSNPYKKETSFSTWNEESSAWIDLNENSKLHNKELTVGFFPFKAKKIVDLILKEFENEGEILEILFEGSDDEFEELSDVCKEEKYIGKIILSRSDISLANARDILPSVKDLFSKMSPLIRRSAPEEKIQRDLSRFSDASSDVVPICVMGNYSTGKSTFINALIGSEILPSGTESVTSKIYKISRSEYSDRAYIKCKYLEYEINLSLTATDSKFNESTLENELVVLIKETINKVKEESIVKRVYEILNVINTFESDAESPKISDLIEVEIPFVNGVLADSKHPFVIFDTPGPNSASNARHRQVLKEAMANMTNGLPILLATADSLDTKDNENLYHMIREMEELDSRFTMIVVNKADGAGIQRRESTEEEQNRILAQAIPRNLYSGGIFYVSSILGLGAKTDGEFIDYMYEDVYDLQVDRYENPDNKHYKTLYLFNIQPSQLKLRSDTLAANQKNLVYANSGLFTIETEIEAFAGKYSAYNKCFQSQMFLTRVIQITEEEIKDKSLECEEIRQSIKDRLEFDKKILIDKLDTCAKENREIYVNSYPEYMTEFVKSADKTFSAKELKDQESIFTKQQEEILGYEGYSDETKKTRSDMTQNIKNNFKTAFKEKSVSSIKKAFNTLEADIESTKDSYQAQKETRHMVDRNAADNLLKHVTDTYQYKLEEIYNLLDSKSKEFWTGKTEEIRNALATIVTGSEVLTDERRIELERIIITYQKIIFKDEPIETIFDKEHFDIKVKIFNQVLWQSDHLNIDKLTNTYNSYISKGANERYSLIEQSHRDSVFLWIQNLLDEIYENIVEYSPELSKKAKQIKLMTEHIEELEERQEKLKQYTEQLITMMDWK